MEYLKNTIWNIIKNGGDIIVPSNNNEAYFFAKSELEKYLSKLFDIFHDVKKGFDKNIYIGKSSDFNFQVKHTKPEGFDVIINEDNLYLISDSDRGIIYCVYDCLEKLGIRFLTGDYTYFPKRISGNVKSYFSEPDFNIRMFLTANICNQDFAVKKRMCSENFGIRKELGGALEWNQTCGCNHSTLNYVPTSIYFTEENKEQNKHMYVLSDAGTPLDICMTDGITDDGEMDESMPVSAFKVALKTLIDLVEKDKRSIYFPFGQMDTTNCCQCERCKKAEALYKRSGMNIRFANLLLKHLRKHFEEKGEKREIKLVIFAYNYSTEPPTVIDENGNVKPLIKADDGVSVRLASIFINSYFPFESDMHFLPYKRILDEWHAVANDLMIWTYHTNYKRYLWYFPTIQHWKQDLQFFKKSGVSYAFMQSNHTEKVDWKADMELYSASKALWDINVNPIKVRDEFIDLFYGKVAKYVKKIIKIFDKNYKKTAISSEKLRREFWKQLFGDAERIPNNLSIAEISKNLRKEADLEWTKNVYFHIYHKEIGWAKVQPKNLLEKQMELLIKAKEIIKCSNYAECDKNRITIALEKIELTLRYMILYNYDKYYQGDKEGKEKASQIFYDLCTKLDYKDFGEGIKIDKIKENIDYGW